MLPGLQIARLSSCPPGSSKPRWEVGRMGQLLCPERCGWSVDAHHPPATPRPPLGWFRASHVPGRGYCVTGTGGPFGRWGKGAWEASLEQLGNTGKRERRRTTQQVPHGECSSPGQVPWTSLLATGPGPPSLGTRSPGPSRVP